MLELLWQRNPALRVDGAMLQAAKEPGDLGFLLARAEDGFRVEEGVVRAAAGSYRRTGELLRVLLGWDPEARSEEEDVLRAVRGRGEREVWEFMLDCRSEVGISEAVVLAVFDPEGGGGFRDKDREEWASLMRERGKKVVFTEKMRVAVDRALESRSQAPLRELIYSLENNSSDFL